MIDALTRYLKKLGVSSYNELNDEEKRTYREWELALSGRQLTDREVRQFLDRELEDAIDKLKPDTPERVDTFLKMKIDFIRRLNAFLDSPKREQEAAAQFINNQL